MEANQSDITINTSLIMEPQIYIIQSYLSYQPYQSYQYNISQMLSRKDQEIASLQKRSLRGTVIKCGSGNRIDLVCTNKDCRFEAFVCSEAYTEKGCQSCPTQNHEGCAGKMTFWPQLLDKVEKQVNFIAKIKREIFQVEDSLMRKLIQSRQELKAQGKQYKNEDSKRFIDSICEKKDIKDYTGAAMSSLLQQLGPSKEQQDRLKVQLQRLKKEGGKMIEGFSNLREEIFDSLRKFNIEIDSKILQKEQKDYLLKQLNHPKNLKLLFRASQHNFSAVKFHQCCNNISDTVTIVRTEFGRTIAAYTPSQMEQCNVNGEWVADDSRRSFLLQLELREKMTLTYPQCAIFNYPNDGPMFGQDLCIADQCNQNQNSYSYFPVSYNCNGKYQQNSQQSYTAFCGSPKGYRFRVVEYEVFVVVSK